MVVVVRKEYRLFASADTRLLEGYVNDLLEKNPNAEIQFAQATTGIYYERESFMICPKCFGKVFETNKNEYHCLDCKRQYFEDEFKKKVQHTAFPLGTLYLQPLIIEIKEVKE